MNSAFFISASKSTRNIAMLLSLWALVVGAGFYNFLKYEATPASDGHPPILWPANAQLAVDEGGLQPDYDCSPAL